MFGIQRDGLGHKLGQLLNEASLAFQSVGGTSMPTRLVFTNRTKSPLIEGTWSGVGIGEVLNSLAGRQVLEKAMVGCALECTLRRIANTIRSGSHTRKTNLRSLFCKKMCKLSVRKSFFCFERLICGFHDEKKLIRVAYPKQEARKARVGAPRPDVSL